jgi:hypothetical protein
LSLQVQQRHGHLRNSLLKKRSNFLVGIERRRHGRLNIQELPVACQRFIVYSRAWWYNIWF